MKFYKFTRAGGNYGMVYKEGVNTDILPWCPDPYCGPGGIYFSREDILAFLDYGEDLWECEPIGNQITQIPGTPVKWKAHSVKMHYVGKAQDNIATLIENGANIHAGQDYALMWALENNRLDLIKYLIINGSNISVLDYYVEKLVAEYGYYALMISINHAICDELLFYSALKNERYIVADCLLLRGVNLHVSNDLALRQAASNGRLESVKYLVSKGANIHAYDDEALRGAADHSHLPIVQYLVSLNANVHAKNDYALRKAAANGDLEIVQHLLYNGASVRAKNNYALRRALSKGHKQIVKCLLVHTNFDLNYITKSYRVYKKMEEKYCPNGVQMLVKGKHYHHIHQPTTRRQLHS